VERKKGPQCSQRGRKKIKKVSKAKVRKVWVHPHLVKNAIPAKKSMRATARQVASWKQQKATGQSAAALRLRIGCATGEVEKTWGRPLLTWTGPDWRWPCLEEGQSWTGCSPGKRPITVYHSVRNQIIPRGKTIKRERKGCRQTSAGKKGADSSLRTN